MASKQHGLTTMNATRPKKKVRDRKNKNAARKRKQVLLTALEEAIAAAKGEHTHKKVESKAAKSAPAKKAETKKASPKAKKPAAKKASKEE